MICLRLITRSYSVNKIMADLIEIDGSVLEGGGQILRVAVSLSALLLKPIRVKNIRYQRSAPGLRPQHLNGIQMACRMCDGNVTGAEIQSCEISFVPGSVKGGFFEVDTRTAGSIGLLLQVGLPIALYGAETTKLVLKGGTNADMAPPIDYTMTVFLPLLKRFGAQCECSLTKRGFYPRGGGEVECKIHPVDILTAIKMPTFGTVTRIWGTSYVAGVLPIKMAHEMADAALNILKRIETTKVKANIDRIKEPVQKAQGNGSGIVLFAETDTGCILAGTALGNRSISTTDVGKSAATDLVSSVLAEYCVDSHTQDQIIILMALAKGKSVVKCGPLTLHTKTAIHIVEKLTNATFKFDESTNCLECDGIGLKNDSR